ncbi:synaptotagmin 1-like isoform X2 [Sitodiplosis mosellana]|uniref:synaptotagmin 1-like isoform X2 n=1 Tax=Sitodiplosis mosellana TaxID=263140 RepID=UPI0024444BDE|nr:synaptotagmin 1-like isoform X2 [Sitodiplosis mosellana]
MLPKQQTPSLLPHTKHIFLVADIALAQLHMVSLIVPLDQDEKVNKRIAESAEMEKLAKWGVVSIYICITLLSLGLLFLSVRLLLKKRRGKDGKNGTRVTDLKAVQYKVKVQPDMEELTQKNEELDEDGINLGKLKYKLDYDFSANSLHVTVIQVEDLPALDVGSLSNPFVKLYLLPDKKKTFETQIYRKTLNALFNETFVFKNLPYAKAMNTTLVLAVFDFSKFTKREIGEVQVPLCQSDLTQTTVVSNIRKIRSTSIPKN